MIHYIIAAGIGAFLGSQSKKSKKSYAEGGEVDDLEYSEIYDVLKDKIEDAAEDISSTYEQAYDSQGEEVEHKSRSGFIPYTDGGFKSHWFEYINMLSGSGTSLPTSVLDKEMQRQVDYNYELAKDTFVEENEELVKEIGEDKVNYHDLYELGYGGEAESLSEMESDMGDDSILMEVEAMYYAPHNDRGIDGKNTIRLSGSVNLEAPYHRRGNLDDYIETEFTFNSVEELETKMDSNLKKVIGWFEGDNYSESKRELKIRKMAKGGKVEDGGMVEYLLYGVAQGKPDYMEEILFVDDKPIRITEKLRDMASAKGFDRLRASMVDLKIAPDFTKALNFKKGGKMQGYNARGDEELGMTDGKESRFKQSQKDRRDEMKGENRSAGNKTYGSFAKGGEILEVEGGSIDLSSKEKTKIYKWIGSTPIFTSDIETNEYNDFDLEKELSKEFDKTNEQAKSIIKGWEISRGYSMSKGGSTYAHGGEVDLDAISKNPPYAVAIDMYGEGDPDDIFVGFYKDNSRYGGGRSYYGRGADKNVRWSMKDVFNDGYEPKIFQTIEDYRAWKKSGSKMAKGGKTRKNTNK